MPSQQLLKPAIQTDGIDSQCEELSARMNQLFAAMSLGRGEGAIGELLDFLKEYVPRRFAEEERLMSGCGYTGYLEHKEEHEGFIKDFLYLKEEYENDGASTFLVLKIERWVCGWIVHHIGKADKALHDFLKANI